MLMSLFKRRIPLAFQIIRCLNESETAAALRPFYFIVHPDLFGQFPKERENWPNSYEFLLVLLANTYYALVFDLLRSSEEKAVNEESLKKLNEYMSLLHTLGYARPTEVIFYLRVGEDDCGLPAFKRIQIPLLSRDIATTIKTILKACSLPLNYINEVVPKRTPTKGVSDLFTRWDHSNYTQMGQKNPVETVKSKPIKTLQKWLRENEAKARAQALAVKTTQEEINRLCDELKSQLALADVRWESVWGFSYFHGCLRSFYRMYAENPQKLRRLLQDRILIFADSTGVSFTGEIVLSTEDVPTVWMTLLISIRAYDSVLERLPYMEMKLSELLSNIRIIRQKKSRIMMVGEYELLLNKLMNTLRKVQEVANTCFFDEDLNHLELVVEGESGPLTLSPTGQFLIPASCPGPLVVEFIVQNKEIARSLLQEAPKHLQRESITRQHCMQKLQLVSLKKDETVSPHQMTDCCTRLVNLDLILSGLQLQISHYYSVMQEGEVCIPWDWTGDTQ